jgi:hypothetical protein
MNKLAAFNMPKKQSMAAFNNVPRRTDINGQDHMLAYIRPDEAQLLKNLGGAGTPGPGGIPQFGFLDWASDKLSSVGSAISDTVKEVVSGGNAVTQTYNPTNTSTTFTTIDTNTGNQTNVATVDWGNDGGITNVTYHDDKDDKPATTTTDYDSSSEVTPFVSPEVQSVEYDPNTGTYSYGGVSGLTDDQLSAALSGGVGVDTGVPGIDTSYVGNGSGSLVTGGASDSNEDFFDSVNTGSNFDTNTNTGNVDTSAKDADLSVGSSTTTTNTGQVDTSSKDADLSVGSSTSTVETNYGGNTGNDTGPVDTSPKYYDMFGNIYSTAYEAYQADQAYYDQSDTTQNNTTNTIDTTPYFDLTDPNEPLVTGDGTPFTGNFDGVQYVNGQPKTSGTTTIYDGGQDTFESTFQANHGVPVPTTESEFMALSNDAKQDLALGLTNDELQELVNTISTNSGENATVAQQLINFGADLIGVQGVGDDLAYKVDLKGMNIDELLPNLNPLQLTVSGPTVTTITTQELEDLYNDYYDLKSETVPFNEQGEVPLTVDELNEIVNAALGEGSEVPLTVQELNNLVNESLASAGDGGGQDDDVGGSGTDFGGLANQDYTDYTESGFQANDLTEGGNTIGYATSGENAGSMAIITPEGNIEILGPGSTETGIVFEGETAINDAIDYLTGNADAEDVPSGGGETITDTSTLQGVLEVSGDLEDIVFNEDGTYSDGDGNIYETAEELIEAISSGSGSNGSGSETVGPGGEGDGTEAGEGEGEIGDGDTDGAGEEGTGGDGLTGEGLGGEGTGGEGGDGEGGSGDGDDDGFDDDLGGDDGVDDGSDPGGGDDGGGDPTVADSYRVDQEFAVRDLVDDFNRRRKSGLGYGLPEYMRRYMSGQVIDELVRRVELADGSVFYVTPDGRYLDPKEFIGTKVLGDTQSIKTGEERYQTGYRTTNLRTGETTQYDTDGNPV